jgi:hypothetical protein
MSQSLEKTLAELLGLVGQQSAELSAAELLAQVRNYATRGYGGLRIHEASLDQIIATGAAQKFDDWQTALVEAGGVDGQVANNRIVVATAGVYLVSWHLSFNTSGAAWWTGHIYLGGVSTGIDWDRNVMAAARPGSVSCASPLTIPANGIIEAYISHDQGGDITCTKLAGQLYVVRIT